MPQLYRVDWDFETVQEARVGRNAHYGWTESWYTQGDSLDSVLGLAGQIAAGSWIALRRTFLATLYRIAFVSATAVANDDGTPLLPFTKTRTLVGQSGAAYNEVGAALVGAQVQCAILVQFTVLPSVGDARAHHRRLMFRGLPASLISGNVINTLSPEYLNALAFFNLVGNHETGQPLAPLVSPWLHAYQDPGALTSPVTDISVAALTPNFITATMPGFQATGLPKGTRLKIANVIAPPGINKRWKATANTAAGGPPILLGKSTRPLFATAQVPFVGPLAIATLLKLKAARINQYSVIRLGSKKTGRPRNLVRGRRSVLGAR